MGRFLLALAVAACGRVGFTPTGSPDGPAAGGSGGGDSGLSDNGDAGTTRANRVFLSAGTRATAIGGLAGADAFCQTSATAAGLSGTFRAFLSTSTANAIDRLAGSRGWVRIDGLPVADTPADLVLGGHTINLIDRDEHGTLIAFEGTGIAPVWTGSDDQGRYLSGETCTDWTSNTGVAGGQIGAFSISAPQLISFTTSGCGNVGHFYCFEIGKDVPVTPVVAPGLRIAFVSTPVGSPGLSGLDAHCQADAASAGLPGTYLAAVATSTGSIESRFALTSAWRRVDGTQISATAAALFDGTDLLAPVSQLADGTYLATSPPPLVKLGVNGAQTVGTSNNTCGDWTLTTGPGVAAGSPTRGESIYFWGKTNGGACNTPEPVLCLQN